MNKRISSGCPNTIAAVFRTPGTIREVAIAYAIAGSATTNPATGPASPTSKARAAW